MCISWQPYKGLMGYLCAERFCSEFSAMYSKQVSFCLFIQTPDNLVPRLDSGRQEDLKTIVQTGGGKWIPEWGKWIHFNRQMEINCTNSEQVVSCSFTLRFPWSVIPCTFNAAKIMFLGLDNLWQLQWDGNNWGKFLKQVSHLSWAPSC